MEEAVHQLGQMTALAWIGRKFTDAKAELSTNNLSITVKLKTGKKIPWILAGK